MADTLWRECAEWLSETKVLSKDHKICWEDAQVMYLAYTLRDGVLLCQLLNSLEEGCLDLKEVSLKPQLAQILCLKNIRIFLHTCKKHFDLKDEDLFEAQELFDYSDFGKVLHTLSKLSHCPKVWKKGIKPFPRTSRCMNYDSDIYRNLEEVANDDTYEELAVLSAPNEDDIKIYEDLCSLRNQTQSVILPHAPCEKRDYCMLELVETESTYLEALKMISSKFMQPLSGEMRVEDWKIVFFNVKKLTDLHFAFHTDLRKCYNNPSVGHRVSNIFLDWKDKFVIYGDYCANLPAAQQLLDELCCKHEAINNCVQACQLEANGGKFRLRDILSLPVQRVLKYHLLLNELKKNTSQDHEDYSDLERSHEAMLDIAEYINEVKRDHDNVQNIEEIQNSITDLVPCEDVHGYGHLLKDGELKIRSHDENKVRHRYAFVFTRVLLICKLTKMMDKFLWGDQYGFKSKISLEGFTLENVFQRKALSKDVRSGHSWILADQSKTQVFTMYAKTEEDKKKWMKALKDALDAMNPIEGCRGHSFIYSTFKPPSSCYVCHKLMKGVSYQGYRCDRCHMIAHKPCLGAAVDCPRSPLPPKPPERPPSQEEHVSCLFGLHSKSAHISQAIVTQPCDGKGPAMLSLRPGETIYVLQKNNPHWWEGKTMDGREGLFPAEIVKEQQLPFRNYEGPESALCPSPQQDGSDYVNMALQQYPWFAGHMTRDEASSKLERMLDGTFLLRISNKQNGSYVLSLNHDNLIRHMKVCSTYESTAVVKYYLSQSSVFRSVVELIEWYQGHSLTESFKGLDTTLKIPFKEAPPAAIVKYDFNNSEPKTLPLKEGQRVFILGREGDNMGWWKGQVGKQVRKE